MQKIVPTIWCKPSAQEAAAFYREVLPDVTGAGEDIEVGGLHILLADGGERPRPNPAINFLLTFSDAEKLRRVWSGLLEGGAALMDLDSYAHSPLYGWVEDKFGVNWQLMLNEDEDAPRVVPQLMFCGAAQNKAAEATDYYISVIPHSAPGSRVRYADMGQMPDNGANIVFSNFTLYGQWFAAMDSAVDQSFTFTEGLSLRLYAADKEEFERLRTALSADPAAEEDGWVQDAWGVSWQIVLA